MRCSATAIRTCVVTWHCPPCGTDHACKLDAHHNDGPHATKRHRLLDVCTFDGKVALRFPDPAKDAGEAIFRPRAARR